MNNSSITYKLNPTHKHWISSVKTRKGLVLFIPLKIIANKKITISVNSILNLSSPKSKLLPMNSNTEISIINNKIYNLINIIKITNTKTLNL